MPEKLHLVPKNIERRPDLFHDQVSQAMDNLADSLSMIPAAFDAIVAPALTMEEGAYPEMVYFDHDKKSYGYSPSFRDVVGQMPIDAMSLIEGDRGIFFQISKDAADPDKKRAIAEAYEGDDVYNGVDALSMLSKVFPEIFVSEELVSQAA